MTWTSDYSLAAWLDRSPTKEFFELTRGVEIELNRTDEALILSVHPHPQGLEDPLFQPYVTKDILESITELITPPDTDLNRTLACLSDLYRLADTELKQEWFWPLSSPPHFNSLGGEAVSKHPQDEDGQWITAYYKALAERYHIAKGAFTGIHANYSFSDEFWQQLRRVKGDNRADRDFRSDVYFGLIRNYYRLAPLVVYLFGCSPLDPCNPELYPEVDEKTSAEMQDVVSMRNSRYGFWTNENYWSLNLNHFDSYINQIESLLGSEGDRLLAPSELYCSIRAKHSGDKGKRNDAMKRDGVEYVELRTVDLNPFVTTGISAEQMRFLDLVIWLCVLSPSEETDDGEKARWRKNIDIVSLYGRRGKCRIETYEGDIDFIPWARTIMAELTLLARWIDEITGGTVYQSVVAHFSLCIEHSEMNLSSRWKAETEKAGGQNQLIAELLNTRRESIHLGPLQYFQSGIGDTHAVGKATMSLIPYVKIFPGCKLLKF